MSYALHCATFRRHLGRQIARAFLANQTALDTIELAKGAYPGRPINNWMRGNVRRHLRMWGYRPVGKRMTGKDGRPKLLWALHKLED